LRVATTRLLWAADNVAAAQPCAWRSVLTIYVAPGQPGSLATFRERYDHWIGGEYVAPASGRYFENRSPVTGRTFTEVARGDAADIERALDAAHGAARSWGRTTATARAVILNKIADRIEANLEMLAVAETWDNGKAIRETLGADIPLAVDHFRYFAGAIRAEEGSISQIDEDTIAYHFHEPLGVVGQIIPWNFPLLMAVWKLAPALAAGPASCSSLRSRRRRRSSCSWSCSRTSCLRA
jgi:aldehyde dehydrogenase